VKRLRKATSFLTVAALCVCLLPLLGGLVQGADWQVGNCDLNIQNGGVMLTEEDDFYFVQGGIFVQSGERVRALSADNGRNLNRHDGALYYTLGASVRCVPLSGGATETVFTAAKTIDVLYLVNGDFLYLSGGKVYLRPAAGGESVRQSAPEGVKRLIPTRYGTLYLTGDPLNYTLWAGTTRLLDGVSSAYTDGDYLALQLDGENYMAGLDRLFSGFNRADDLERFNIHGTVSLYTLLSPDEENTISEDNDNNALQMDFAALLRDAGLTRDTVSLMTEGTAEAGIIPTLSEGQKNIVKRARQLTEIQWTPLEDRNQWGYYGTFKAETTYTGIPYGQPVNTNGYIGYGVSLETFAAAVLDNTSRFYTGYSNYNKIAPALSTDCSGYVSYAWGLKSRKTTYYIGDVAERVGDQSVYSLQVGDCLNEASSHVVLISSLTYDANGTIVGLQVMEQTPVITRVTNYGQGQAKSLASFQSYYLNGGYVIYRYPDRDNVTYTPSPVVPLDGETVAGQKETAPKSRTSAFVGGKTVSLTSDAPGSVIYYTLDGSAPTTNSTRYSAAISLTKTTKLRAIAVSPRFADSTILEYMVKVPQADTPKASVVSGQGMSLGEIVSAGTQVKLESTAGATIYYTTDGTQPTTASRVYSTPIAVTQDMTIRAFAEGTGLSRSETMTAAYRIGRVFSITATAGAGGSISPSGADQILETGSKTYTITPANGFAIKDVLVDGVSVGAVTSYTFSNVTAGHTISATFQSTAELPFTDVGANAWYFESVSYVYASGLFNGTSGTAFSPETTMTRGMFITVLGRFAGLPSGLNSGVGMVTGTGVNIRRGPSTDTEIAGFVADKNSIVQVTGKSGDWYGVKYGEVTGFIRSDLLRVYSNNYADLASGQYYSPYAEWAWLTGIANGVAGGSFAADSSITREHMCMLLYNYAVAYGRTLPQNVDKAAFSDDAAISAGAKTAVYALQQAGVIDGMGNGIFAPQGTATRAQVAQIFRKFSAVAG
jgi:uncharacterized protein YgiM (DUF1202 family)